MPAKIVMPVEQTEIEVASDREPQLANSTKRLRRSPRGRKPQEEQLDPDMTTTTTLLTASTTSTQLPNVDPNQQKRKSSMAGATANQTQESTKPRTRASTKALDLQTSSEPPRKKLKLAASADDRNAVFTGKSNTEETHGYSVPRRTSLIVKFYIPTAVRPLFPSSSINTLRRAFQGTVVPNLAQSNEPSPLVSSPNTSQARTLQPSPVLSSLRSISQTKHTCDSKGKQRVTTKAKIVTPPVVDPRPNSWGQPEVWAESRSDLCAALPHYKTYQGAAYTLKGVVHAMLLDEDCGERSYMDENIVITRAGGGIGDNEDGKKEQTKDQDPRSAKIHSFTNNMDKEMPLQLILGSKNIHCPSKIPYRYCAMGPFHITYIWAEKIKGKVCFKYRIQKRNLSSKSWWAAKTSQPLPHAGPDTKIKAFSKECDDCHVTNKQVYQEGWICLNHACSSFWTLSGSAVPRELRFDVAFINELTVFDVWEPPHNMKPDLIDPNGEHSERIPVNKQGWGGIVCPHCGRCNARRHWDAWRCQTEGCSFIRSLPHKMVYLNDVNNGLLDTFHGHAIPADTIEDPKITLKVVKHGFFRMHSYCLSPGSTISHFLSNEPINATPGGANDVFYALQKVDIGLQRFPMKSAVVPGMLSAHFSSNFGMPYKYVVDVNSKGFKDAPPEILEAVRRCTWAGERTIQDGPFGGFNECLVVGYFTDGQMHYHDDGESTLGPTVASWSLGCPALMSVRMKMKYYSGFKDKNRTKYDPSLPILNGCFRPEARERLNELARTVNAETLNAAAIKAMKGIRSEAPPVLVMLLRHGDFMVMHGEDIQKYYEHALKPTDKLRFALTCRYVKPEMLDKGELWKGKINLDPAKKYDGDLKVYDDKMEERYGKRDLVMKDASATIEV